MGKNNHCTIYRDYGICCHQDAGCGYFEPRGSECAYYIDGKCCNRAAQLAADRRKQEWMDECSSSATL